MRTVAAILAYLMAATGGLAAGYYATAPHATAAPVVSAARGADRHEPHAWRGGPSDLEAAAAFLEAEERHPEGAAQPASADL
jgi:hypothetical protein